MTTDLTIQAATDAALIALLLTHGVLQAGEGIQPAPGVMYSHIGDATLDGVPLDGRYAFVGIDESVYGTAQTQALVTALAEHTYTGPDIRVRLGGAGYNPGTVQQIKNERDRRILSSGYKVGTKWYHSDLVSRTQQMGLVMMGANVPPTLQWKTMDGTFVAMTQTLAQQIFAAAATSDQTHHAVAEAAIAAYNSNPAGFDMASIAWPARFA